MTADPSGPSAPATGPVLVEDRATEHGTVRVLRLHRPAARNAMDTALLVALLDALHDAEDDADLRGVLLTGGDECFSAGADTREVTDDGGRRRMELFTHVYERLTSLRHPTAAAVEGPAVGGGAEVAAACDLRVLARGSMLRFPGASFGLPVGPGRLTANVGLGTARDWVLSCRDVTAAEAHATGFAQRLVDDGEAEATAMAWLAIVASRDPDAVRLLKRMFLDFSGLSDDVAWENDALRATVEAGRIPPGLDVDTPRTIRPRRR